MWDAFKDLIFQIIQFFYDFCGDWGMAIIIVTVIFRVLISPLMHKQTKSSFQMQRVQPLMKEIQTKYADDPQRQQEEMQKERDSIAAERAEAQRMIQELEQMRAEMGLTKEAEH